MRSILIIDGNNIAYRNFAAHKELRTSEGESTGAVFGFLNSLRHLVKYIKPILIVVCWDGGRKTWRKDVFAEYKANRSQDGDYDDYQHQIERLKEVLCHLQAFQIQVADVEADDLVGIIYGELSKSHPEVRFVIVSSDKDYYQLLGTDLYIVDRRTGKNHVYSANWFQKQFGIYPHQWIDVRAIEGDTSDNIPGVKGVGPVNAIRLIQEHGSLEGIALANADDRFARLVVLNLEKALLYRQLVRIPLAPSTTLYKSYQLREIWNQIVIIKETKTPRLIMREPFTDFCLRLELESIFQYRNLWYQDFRLPGWPNAA